MIVTLREGADLNRVKHALAERGLWVRPLLGGPHAQLLVEPHSAAVTRDALLAVDGVAGVSAPASEHPLVDAQPRTVRIAGVELGHGARPVFMAGPCSVESEVQIESLAARLAPLGVRFLRGGAYKPRTSPYSFQGHGPEALRWLRAAADRHGLGVVTEAMSEEAVDVVAAAADLIQIGSRNMSNFSLLRAAGRTRRPILLKRGMSATVEEWLSAAEYCLLHGAQAVLLCERGIRGFDPSTRNLLDLGAVALLSHVYKLPVLVDPSHAVGRRDLIPALSQAALAAGACGLLIETHDHPGAALSDGPQALLPEQLAALVQSCESREAPAQEPPRAAAGRG